MSILHLTDRNPFARIVSNIQYVPLTQARSFLNSQSKAEQPPGFGRLEKPETPLLSNRRPVHELIADSLRLTIMADRLTLHKGGLMWIKHPPGTFLREGDAVVDMMDVWGDIVEEVKVPYDGYCWNFTGGVGYTQAVPGGTQIAVTFRER